MTISTKTSIKSFFETGDKPTQTEFADFIDTAIPDWQVGITSAAASAGLAQINASAGTLAPYGTFGLAMLATGTSASAVTLVSGALASGAVTSGTIASGAVTSETIASGAVTSEVIANAWLSALPTATPVSADIVLIGDANDSNNHKRTTVQAVLDLSSTLTQGTAVNAATGSPTAVGFTSIPAWAKHITMTFSGLSTNGTSNPMVQIGDSGGYEASSYLGSYSTVGISTANMSTGFALATSHGAASVLHGTIELTLVDSSTNTWAMTGRMGNSDSAVRHQSDGSKALSGTLDRIQITTAGGTDTFDAGTVNVQYA